MIGKTPAAGATREQGAQKFMQPKALARCSGSKFLMPHLNFEQAASSQSIENPRFVSDFATGSVVAPSQATENANYSSKTVGHFVELHRSYNKQSGRLVRRDHV